MFFIRKGTCRVIVGGKEVGTMEAGKHFGEIAIVADNTTRTATIQAMEFCDLSLLYRDAFEEIIEIYPKSGEMIAHKIKGQMAGCVICSKEMNRAKRATRPSVADSRKRQGEGRRERGNGSLFFSFFRPPASLYSSNPTLNPKFQPPSTASKTKRLRRRSNRSNKVPRVSMR